MDPSLSCGTMSVEVIKTNNDVAYSIESAKALEDGETNSVQWEPDATAGYCPEFRFRVAKRGEMRRALIAWFYGIFLTD